MKFISIAQAKRESGVSYIGQVNNGAKHKKAYNYNELVYTIYFAPAKCSGYEVCPGRSQSCTAACLNMSGMNRMNMKNEMILNSRIRKTKLFFEERDFTVRWIIQEIKNAQKKAQAKGYEFSVRLNNTSDISPEDFYIVHKGKIQNILQIFPNIKFYDYTKVPSRIELIRKYPNYDLTFSYNGENMELCESMLRHDVRVAIVFNGKLPDVYLGRPVINADLYDMRYKDPKNVIVGLHYKKVRNKLKPENKFVIQ